MTTACVLRARAAALRRPRTTLWRSILLSGRPVQIGVLRFRMALTESEAKDLMKVAPHAWLLRLGPDLWAQEVLPGADEWESDQ